MKNSKKRFEKRNTHIGDGIKKLCSDISNEFSKLCSEVSDHGGGDYRTSFPGIIEYGNIEKHLSRQMLSFFWKNIAKSSIMSKYNTFVDKGG